MNNARDTRVQFASQESVPVTVISGDGEVPYSEVLQPTPEPMKPVVGQCHSGSSVGDMVVLKGV